MGGLGVAVRGLTRWRRGTNLTETRQIIVVVLRLADERADGRGAAIDELSCCYCAS